MILVQQQESSNDRYWPSLCENSAVDMITLSGCMERGWSGFIIGTDRNQATLFPEKLDDYVAEESATRIIDFFVDELD